MNIEILLYLNPYFHTFMECDVPKIVAWYYLDIAFDQLITFCIYNSNYVTLLRQAGCTIGTQFVPVYGVIILFDKCHL
jgi:hypothetical protein